VAVFGLYRAFARWCWAEDLDILPVGLIGLVYDNLMLVRNVVAVPGCWVFGLGPIPEFCDT
jgi:hypothetical protein